jgi:hypothetical protein
MSRQEPCHPKNQIACTCHQNRTDEYSAKQHPYKFGHWRGEVSLVEDRQVCPGEQRCIGLVGHCIQRIIIERTGIFLISKLNDTDTY